MDEKNKKVTTGLIPFRREGNNIVVFLQKRTADAKSNPNNFGFFGGSIENNEKIEESLLRETREEMNFVLKNFSLLGVYKFGNTIRHVFYSEVDKNFENNIKILEGEYGKFFDEKEIGEEPKIGTVHKKILIDLFEKLKK